MTALGAVGKFVRGGDKGATAASYKPTPAGTVGALAYASKGRTVMDSGRTTGAAVPTTGQIWPRGSKA